MIKKKYKAPKWSALITKKESTRGRPINHITFKGETRTIRNWEKHLGLKPRVLTQRLSRGWSIKDAFTLLKGSYPTQRQEDYSI
jgi:hypothetical protein